MLQSPQDELRELRLKLANRTSQAVGHFGEQTAAVMLREAGYLVSFTQPGENRGDLVAIDPDTGETLHVEVKTARRSSTGPRWKFCLRKKGKTTVAHADVVVLLAVLVTGHVVPFVIPSDHLRAKNLTITTHPSDYSGKWACYRQRAHALTLGVQ